MGAAIGYLSAALEAHLHIFHLTSALAITYEGLGQHHKAGRTTDELLGA